MGAAESLESANQGDPSPGTDEQALASKTRRSSFYLAMRVLPRVQREAMYEIYRFCRAVDDIADDGGDIGPRRAALDQWRARIDSFYVISAAGAPARASATREDAGLVRAIAQFDLQRDDFMAVIDGMQMDLDSDIQAPDFATLDLYCDRVASAVGRLSTQVFGLPRDVGIRLAHHLGRALQFTNILRDLDEDADINRLYLSRESLADAGIAERTPRAVLDDPRLALACEWLARAAEAHYDQAAAVMRGSARSRVRAPRLMGVVYREILDRTQARGWNAPRERVSIPRPRLMWLLLRYGFV